ncbi:MAG: hypothetical protein R3C49_24005 [Planctomycetaceae bacterium]
MTNQDFNPYQAPVTTDVISESSSTEKSYARRATIWTVIVALNLPVVTWFGIAVTEGAARLGMVVGVLAVWGTGMSLNRTHPRVISFVNGGGILTALSQFFPMLQMWAGMAALTLVSILFMAEGSPPHRTVGRSLTAVTLTTLFTAAIVIVAGCLLFGFVRLVGAGFRRLMS